MSSKKHMKCSKTETVSEKDRNKLKNIINKLQAVPLVGPVLRHRFIKFGTVGFSGTIVNLTVLFLNQEILFKNIYPMERRLHISLSGAIFVATMSNFLWNRWWTWNDRKGKTKHGFFVQMGQYYLASGLAISIQYFFTILLARFTHYLIANILSIIIAAFITYIVNDIWTFAMRKR